MQDEKLLDILVSLGKKCSSFEAVPRKRWGLSPSEYRCLICLLPEEKISCQHLSERVELSVSRSSRIIEGLYRKGFLERADCTSDRRCKEVWLTARGIQARLNIHSHLELCEERLLAEIPEERLAGLKADLKELAVKF